MKILHHLILYFLVIQSSYTPSYRALDKQFTSFIRGQNEASKYIANYSASEFLIGESRIADNTKIVTYVGRKEISKNKYLNLNIENTTLFPRNKRWKVFIV